MRRERARGPDNRPELRWLRRLPRSTHGSTQEEDASAGRQAVDCRGRGRPHTRGDPERHGLAMARMMAAVCSRVSVTVITQPARLAPSGSCKRAVRPISGRTRNGEAGDRRHLVLGVPGGEVVTADHMRVLARVLWHTTTDGANGANRNRKVTSVEAVAALPQCQTTFVRRQWHASPIRRGHRVHWSPWPRSPTATSRTASGSTYNDERLACVDDPGDPRLAAAWSSRIDRRSPPRCCSRSPDPPPRRSPPAALPPC